MMSVLHKISEFARSLYNDFKEFLSPSFCLGCNGNILSDDPLLCESCIETLKKANAGEGPICPFCGRPDGIGDRCRFCRKQERIRLFFSGEYDGLLKDCKDNVRWDPDGYPTKYDYLVHLGLYIRWKGDKKVTALGILFIVFSIIGITGIVYVLIDKKHFKDKEA